jgi:hypothetical protein
MKQNQPDFSAMLQGGGMGDIKSIAENADNLIEIISKIKEMSVEQH